MQSYGLDNVAAICRWNLWRIFRHKYIKSYFLENCECDIFAVNIYYTWLIFLINASYVCIHKKRTDIKVTWRDPPRTCGSIVILNSLFSLQNCMTFIGCLWCEDLDRKTLCRHQRRWSLVTFGAPGGMPPVEYICGEPKLWTGNLIDD